jgi:non-specific serine/threonine protein kinase
MHAFTLVGPGGVGKTRLAPRAAVDLKRTVPGSSIFAGLEDPNLVANAVMTNLGLVDQSGEWPTTLERS